MSLQPTEGGLRVGCNVAELEGLKNSLWLNGQGMSPSRGEKRACERLEGIGRQLWAWRGCETVSLEESRGV